MKRPTLEAATNAAMLASSTAVLVLCGYLLFRHSPQQQRSVDVPTDRSIGAVLDTDGLRSIGSKSAALGIVEFSDFECPFCRRFAQDTFGPLQQQLVDTGRVRYHWASFPLETIHKSAFRMAEAEICAWEKVGAPDFRLRLFSLDPPVADAMLLRQAEAMGIEAASFASCLNVGRREAVTREVEMGKSIAVTVTPTFIVGTMDSRGRLTVHSRIVGAKPLESFLRVFPPL